MFRWFFCCSLLVTPAFCSLSFEPNRGQTDASVQFLARTSAPGSALFLTAKGEIIFKHEKFVQVSFAGSNPAAAWQGLAPTGNTTHYFVGRDPQKWIRGLQSFERVTRPNLYPGIDLVLYGNRQNQLEYDLAVSPGADPSRIRIRIAGGSAPRIDPRTGDLVIGGIRHRKPVIFQNQKQIAGAFRKINAREFGFIVGAYDRTQPLTIDPVIESREYLGGLGDDSVNGVWRGDFASGTTASIDFPNAPIGAPRRGTDVFLRAGGNTYIMGGSGDETAANVAFDSSLIRVFIAGTTTSRDLPTDPNSLNSPARLTPAQANFQGGASDGFIWVFDLTFTTGFTPFVAYYGTPGDDRINAVITLGNRFALAGSTTGATLPAGLAATRPQPNPGGGLDAFVATGIHANIGLQYLNATFIGGSLDDRALAITEANGSLFAGGETASPFFPGRNLSQRRGPTDAFLVELTNPFDAGFAFGAGITLLGGSGSDRIQSLAWSPATQTILAAGTTDSTDFPVTQPLQSTYGGGATDAFLTAFNPTLTQIQRSTYFGGTGADEGLAVAADSLGHHFLAGKTGSRNLLIRNAIQANYGGGASDGFLVHFDPPGAVDYSTYYGGLGEDEILALGEASGPTIYAGGATNSTDLPGPVGRSGAVPVSIREGFIVRISNAVITLPALTLAGQGTRAAIPVSFGDSAQLLAAGRATIESSAPSRVLVSFSGLAVALDTALWNTANAAPATAYAECLADSGDTDVTLRAPGYPDQVTRVRCVPGQLALTPSLGAPLLTGESVQVVVEFGINDPATGQFQRLPLRFTPDVTATALSVTSSNPQAVFVPPGIPGQNSRILRALRPGDAVITAAAPGFRSATLAVGVAATARHLDAAIGFDRYESTPCLLPCRVRSLDPNRVLLTTSYRGFGAGEVTLFSSDLYIRVVNGAPVGAEVQLEISHATDGPFLPFRVVHIVQPLLFVTATLDNPVEILRGNISQLTLAYTTKEGGGQGISPSISDPLSQTTFESSNPAVFTVSRDNLQLRLAAVGDGLATLTVRAPAGLRLSADLARGIPIRVTSKTLALQDFDLGKDLIANRSISMPPVTSSTTVTISTSTPTLLQLAGPDGIPTSTLQVQSGISGLDVGFSAIGLASQGEGRITVTVPGHAPVNATVRLRPAGYIWLRESLSLLEGSSAAHAPVPAVLDPVTRIPFQTAERLAAASARDRHRFFEPRCGARPRFSQCDHRRRGR